MPPYPALHHNETDLLIAHHPAARIRPDKSSIEGFLNDMVEWEVIRKVEKCRSSVLVNASEFHYLIVSDLIHSGLLGCSGSDWGSLLR